MRLNFSIQFSVYTKLFLLFIIAVSIFSCHKSSDLTLVEYTKLNDLGTIGTHGTKTGEFNWNSNSLNGRVAHDGNYLYVIDEGNYRIQRFDNTHTFIDWIGFDSNSSQIETFTKDGSGNDAFRPKKVLYANNHIYIFYYNTEIGKSIICEIDSKVNIVNQVILDSYYFSNPYDDIYYFSIAIDSKDNLYVHYYYQIHKINSNGNYMGCASDRGEADSLFLTENSNLIINKDTLYCSDPDNNKIVRYTNGLQFIDVLNSDIEHSNISIDNNKLYAIGRIIQELNLSGEPIRNYSIAYEFNILDWIIKNGIIYSADYLNEVVNVYALEYYNVDYEDYMPIQ